MPGNLRFLSPMLLMLLAGCGAEPAAPDPVRVTTGEARAVREAAEMIGTRPDALATPPSLATASAASR